MSKRVDALLFHTSLDASNGGFCPTASRVVASTHAFNGLLVNRAPPLSPLVFYPYLTVTHTTADQLTRKRKIDIRVAIPVTATTRRMTADEETEGLPNSLTSPTIGTILEHIATHFGGHLVVNETVADSDFEIAHDMPLLVTVLQVSDDEEQEGIGIGDDEFTTIPEQFIHIFTPRQQQQQQQQRQQPQRQRRKRGGGMEAEEDETGLSGRSSWFEGEG